MNQLNKIWNEDCVGDGVGLSRIADKSVDMILCDLPYGTTKLKWDSIIPFDKLWAQYERIIKDNGAIILTASQPFTSFLVMSNPKLFKYEWVWDKVNKYTMHVHANRMPLKRHENVLVFYKNQPVYNKQYREGKPYKASRTNGNGEHYTNGKEYTRHDTINTGLHNPCSVLQIEGDSKKSLHPTQKPVELFEYLIKTYTNKGELVVDNCAGSFTTAVACENLNRNWICIEQDRKYCEIGRDRILANRKRLKELITD